MEEIQKKLPNWLSPSDIAKCSGLRFAIDTETTGLNWWECHMTDVGIYCPDANLSGVIPVEDRNTEKWINAELSKLAPGTVMIMHNAKFDCHFLEIVPKRLKLQLVDTTVAIHLLDSRYKKAMKDAEEIFLGSSSKREYVGEAPARTKIWDWPADLRALYCENDCKVTYQLAQELIPQLYDMGLYDLFCEQMDYISCLTEIENWGVLADKDFMIRADIALQKHLELLEQQLYDSVGYVFNWRSTKQLSKALYEDLGIAKPKNPFADSDGVDRSRFADGGKYKSTCTSTFLLTEKVHHPLGELVSALREAKLMRSFISKWQELAERDGVFHCSFNPTGTRTGRLSCSKPNLQNVPSEVRGRFTQSVFTGDTTRADEYNLRLAFVARPGTVFLSIDFKQMEIRMFGILSKDPNMLKALTSGMDVHLYIALEIWGDCGEEVNKIHREWSKTISFGILYGMTVGSLMYKLNMERSRAMEVINQYKGYFPRVDPWMFEIIESCKSMGYVRYWSNRIWREEDPTFMYRGCNALIQGGCADMLSICVLRVSEWIDKQKNPNDYHIVNLVHDEIIMEVPEWDVERVAIEIADIMSVSDLFDIPFATDAKWGTSYGDLLKKGKSAEDAHIYAGEVEEEIEEDA